MNSDQKLALQTEVAANPHLFSARHNKDLETITSVLNETRDEKLSKDDVLDALLYKAPEPEAKAE